MNHAELCLHIYSLCIRCNETKIDWDQMNSHTSNHSSAVDVEAYLN